MRSTPPPLWQRVLGGAIGMALLVGLLLLARSQGVSGRTAGEWQTTVVIGVGGAWLLAYLWRRSRR